MKLYSNCQIIRSTFSYFQLFTYMMRRGDSFEKTLMLGKYWGWEEKGMTEDERAEWHLIFFPEKHLCFIDYANKSVLLIKLLMVWITKNCGKFLKRWEYQTTWPASWETCIQVRKQQLELDMEQQTGSK